MVDIFETIRRPFEGSRDTPSNALTEAAERT
jgi:hypothetical protein